jgi:sugar lactone lactonase YvrE
LRIRLLISLMLAATVGCQANLPTRNTPASRRPAAEVQRLIAQSGVTAEFSGRARIISDNGLGIISNNSGAIISDNGLGLISDNGLGLISNNGGGLQGRYGVLEAAEAKRPESLLADAKIEVLDAQGRVLVDSKKKPIVAVTDKQGAYKFKAVLPAEHLVLRIKLWNGGYLYGLLVHDAATGARTLDLNTASTLGTHYVLEKFVKKRKAVLDRLPAKEAQALLDDMETARAHLPKKAPTYKSAELLALAEDLRKKDTALNQRLDHIESILLVGQSNLGTGMQATQVSLGFPVAITGDADGRLYVAEVGGGRIRHVNADGTIGVTADNLGVPRGLVRSPDGALIVADTFANVLRRVKADGTTEVIAGNGRSTQGPLDVAPTKSAVVRPQGLAYAPDGTLYIGEIVKDDAVGTSRILAIGPDNVLRQVPTDAIMGHKTLFTGLACDAEGALYAVDGKAGRLFRKPVGGEWAELANGLDPSEYLSVFVDADNRVLVAESDANRVVLVKPDGSREPFAGTGTAGFSGDDGPAAQAQVSAPGNMWQDADGTIFLADAGNGMVRAIDRSGRIRTVAGVNGIASQGDALSLAINSPTAIAMDPQGRLVVSESASNTVKRLENGQLTIVAGTAKGYGGDGGAATAAQLDTPTGIAFADGAFYVADSTNHRIRKVDAAGIITTVAGADDRGSLSGDVVPALSAICKLPLVIAVGPDGQPVWSDNGTNQILKLRPDGQVERVAGLSGGKAGDSGDGGRAKDAALKFPAGVAFDSKGSLYIADSGNMRIRKVTPDGTITTFAGLPLEQALPKLLGGALGDEGGKAADAVLLGPANLCFDAADNMYVAEAGTTNLTSLGSLDGMEMLLGSLPKVGARIRKIAPDGTITTVAGQGGKALNEASGDNALKRPVGLLVDQQGRLVICDGANNQIRMLPKGSF